MILSPRVGRTKFFLPSHHADCFSGGSAAAAGSLVQQLGGQVLGYIFLLELDFLKGRAKLDAPVSTLLSSQEKAE
jgi:hypothetical protein